MRMRDLAIAPRSASDDFPAAPLAAFPGYYL
jgi:hypothetical protein